MHTLASRAERLSRMFEANTETVQRAPVLYLILSDLRCIICHVQRGFASVAARIFFKVPVRGCALRIFSPVRHLSSLATARLGAKEAHTNICFRRSDQSQSRAEPCRRVPGR